jgi:hypothetical protein
MEGVWRSGLPPAPSPRARLQRRVLIIMDRAAGGPHDGPAVWIVVLITARIYVAFG